ncbi:UNKNOWN [Stylonychia lemnae]|uniref:Transmembrane protein n=1 Tax=Stylonychia lemnae TaxID=5949 RepID=A0A078AP46_STYLE|nr:UNKNOWN [Stylonychia lemnae]|eukprot:CDW83092.1 UNKNOWN [Stylonychia lemnae]
MAIIASFSRQIHACSLIIFHLRFFKNQLIKLLVDMVKIAIKALVVSFNMTSPKIQKLNVNLDSNVKEEIVADSSTQMNLAMLKAGKKRKMMMFKSFAFLIYNVLLSNALECILLLQENLLNTKSIKLAAMFQSIKFQRKCSQHLKSNVHKQKQ